MIKRQKNKNTQRGQTFVEYIIIVALLAVSAIAAFSYFGKTVRNQVSALATEIGGSESEAQIAAAKAAALEATVKANKNYNLGNFDEGGNKGSAAATSN